MRPTPVIWPGEFHGQSMESQKDGHYSATFTFTSPQHPRLQGMGFLGYKRQQFSILLAACKANGAGLVVRGIVHSSNTCAPLPRF